MASWNSSLRGEAFLTAVLCLSLSAGAPAVAQPAQTQVGKQPSAQTSAMARPVGTINSISGNTITLTTDAGNDVTVLVQDATKLIRMAPGQKDLKDATPIQWKDVLPGDRILVRGKLANDGKSVLATSIIAMKKADIVGKQAREREEWQKHGLAGLVSNIDAANSTITIALPVLGEKKNVVIRVSKDTILRRYAPDSVKFDSAKPAPLDQIKLGDQLRARGTRSADGNALTAEEIVSGTFRNIAGTISTLETAAGHLIVQDLVSKKSVSVKITSESQLRKLPPPMAQRIAMLLTGVPADAPSSGAAGRGVSAAQTQEPNGRPSGGPGTRGPEGIGKPAGGGPPDLQQALNRMPAITLTDLQKGEAVMIVATEGGPDGIPVAITLLGGVEPILEASPSSTPSTILSPWSLGSALGGEAATP